MKPKRKIPFKQTPHLYLNIPQFVLPTDPVSPMLNSHGELLLSRLSEDFSSVNRNISERP